MPMAAQATQYTVRADLLQNLCCCIPLPDTAVSSQEEVFAGACQDFVTYKHLCCLGV